MEKMQNGNPDVRMEITVSTCQKFLNFSETPLPLPRHNMFMVPKKQ